MILSTVASYAFLEKTEVNLENMPLLRGGESGITTSEMGERARPFSLRSRYIVSEANWVIIIKIKFLSIFSAHHSSILFLFTILKGAFAGYGERLQSLQKMNLPMQTSLL